ncbi:MAG: cyclase family protein [Gammaproteobacteria bacterium]|nr:cyclase family protein [Gammaproteobacteria bacterium]MBT8150519.1 cyclase family protein [Gammaproteobacteria bacterium]NND38516.1 cyclase family protein [Pseudomonadales bacterium]NNM11903.1 cyclase family protein [Pseudomonadales bacterium]
MQVIDLSKPIQYNRDDPPFMRVKIKHKPHWLARWIVRALGLPFKYMPRDFVGWSDDTITQMGVHSTTHIDAPWHYGPTSGEPGHETPAESIDKMPLEKGIGPGVVIDMSHKADGEMISANDIKKELKKSGAQISEGTIVLIRTDRDQFLGSKEYWKRGTGMSAEATEWLIDQGSTVMGIDQWGWDLPFHHQIRISKQQKRNDLFWEGHRLGQRKPYWQMEQLTNLAALPSHGFQVCVFPLKIVGASAAPARVVALLET